MNWLKFTFLVAAISCSKQEDKSIIGEWKIDSYVVNSTSALSYLDESMYLTIKQDKSTSLYVAPNTCSGSYSLSEGELSFDDSWVCTEACCSSEQGQKVQGLFSRVNGYHYVNSDLKLTGDSSLVIYLTPKQ